MAGGGRAAKPSTKQASSRLGICCIIFSHSASHIIPKRSLSPLSPRCFLCTNQVVLARKSVCVFRCLFAFAFSFYASRRRVVYTPLSLFTFLQKKTHTHIFPLIKQQQKYYSLSVADLAPVCVCVCMSCFVPLCFFIT